MSLVSIKVDAVEDRTLDPVHLFCEALLGLGSIVDVVTPDFTWLGCPVGWSASESKKLTSWLVEGHATVENVRMLSASVLKTMPVWALERAFGALANGDRIALFDLRRGEDFATIALVLGGQGSARGRIRRAIDPVDFVRIVKLAQALSG